MKKLILSLLLLASSAFGQGILAVEEGGTGRATSTTAYGLLTAGTTATGAQQTLAAGLTTEILVGGGSSALPVWTTATGSGAPVRATSPTLVTPALGVATATSLNGNTFTTGTYTLTGAAGKTLTFSNTLTLAGTDGTTLTFPTTSATIARTDAGQTFTGTQTVSVGGLAATSGDGLTLLNPTAATSGVPVQVSPRLRMRGSGWKTDATATSQTLDITAEVIPMTGASRAAGGLRLKAFLDGAEIAIGRVDLRHATLATNISGWGSTFLGYRAGEANFTSGTDGYNNTFIGGASGVANDTGYANAFFGTHSGMANTSGFYNVYIGDGAGMASLTASKSVYIGIHAGLESLGSGGTGDNVYIGFEAGNGATGSTANSNVFIGASAGRVITSATSNAVVGRNAANTLTSGNGNALLGDYVAYSLTTGSDNVIIGNLAGYTNTPANALVTGSNNVYVGRESGASVGGGALANSIAIGYRAQAPASNTAVIGNSSIVTTYLQGGVVYTVQALSGAGAVNLTTDSTEVTSTGVAQALTLADGVHGQRKSIIHGVDGGSAVLTPTTKTGFSTVTFTNAGESVTLRFLNTRGWTVESYYLATIAP